MKKLLFIAFMAVSFIAKSQTIVEKLIDLPTKDGKLFFEGVVQVDSTFKKEQLYSKSREWFVNYYKSAKDVLQMDDRADGKLIGKGLHPYNFVNGINVSKITLLFTINITVKDGKYRYQIYDFSGENANTSLLSSTSTTISKIDFDDEYQKLTTDGSRKKYRLKLLQGLQTEVMLIVTSLEKAMKAKASADF